MFSCNKMNWSLVIPLLAIMGIKLIGTTLFLRYFSQIFVTPPLQEDPSSNNQGIKVCAIGWVSFGGKCYSFSAQEKTWNDSRNDCVQSNSDLAVVNSDAELMFLKDRTQNANYFIGLTREGLNASWKWIDNTKLDLNIFKLPYGEFNCAVVGLFATGAQDCSVPRRWICEKNT